MPRINLIRMTFLVIVAVMTTVSSTACAALPEFSPPKNKITETVGGKAEFASVGGIAPITCTSSKGAGEITSAKLGTLDDLFLGCGAPLANNCTGLNDKVAGSILVKSVFDLRYITKKSDVAITFLVEEVHLECDKLISLVSIRGCAASLATPLNTKAKTLVLKLTQKSGVQVPTEVLDETNTKTEKCILEAETNGGSFKQTGWLDEKTALLEKEGEIIA